MKAKIKQLYEGVRPFYKLAAEINAHALNYNGNSEDKQEYWDSVSDATSAIEDAIDILQEILDDY